MDFLEDGKVILAVIATAALAYLLHTVDVDRIEANNAATIKTQIESDTKTCATAQNITKGTDDALTSKTNGLDTDYLAALNSLREQSAASHNSPAASGVNHGTACPSIHVCKNGVDAGALLSYAKDAEHYRLQLSSCQSFITETWAANAQPSPPAEAAAE